MLTNKIQLKGRNWCKRAEIELTFLHCISEIIHWFRVWHKQKFNLWVFTTEIGTQLHYDLDMNVNLPKLVFVCVMQLWWFQFSFPFVCDFGMGTLLYIYTNVCIWMVKFKVKYALISNTKRFYVVLRTPLISMIFRTTCYVYWLDFIQLFHCVCVRLIQWFSLLYYFI